MKKSRCACFQSEINRKFNNKQPYVTKEKYTLKEEMLNEFSVLHSVRPFFYYASRKIPL